MKPRRVARAKTANPLRANPKRAAAPTGALPSRDELLAFLSGQAAPNGAKPAPRVTKRGVARAFGVKGEDKGALKALLKDLEAEGARRKRRQSRRHQAVGGAMTPPGLFG